jgi:hypothetical protein
MTAFYAYYGISRLSIFFTSFSFIRLSPFAAGVAATGSTDFRAVIVISKPMLVA